MSQRRPGAATGDAGRDDAQGIAAAVEAAELAHAPADWRGPARPRRLDALAPVIAVGGGAVLGANARYLAGLAVERWWGSAFPWGTLLVNVAGSFVLGFYLTLATERFAGRATTRLFVATGFLGSFTTLSTFSYETVQVLQHGQPGPALAYAGATLAAGLLAVAAGIGLARAIPLPGSGVAGRTGRG